VSCGQQQTATDVDPQLGRDCFNEYLAFLPPGSQYEGIERADEERLTIRVMDGVRVKTVKCLLTSDGTVTKAEE
jgi:hypothetical protein